MEYKLINGHTAVTQHIFKGSEIEPGSLWIGSGSTTVKVEYVVECKSKEEDSKPLFDVFYSWYENGVKKTHSKDSFSFQCRYCLIVNQDPTKPHDPPLASK